MIEAVTSFITEFINQEHEAHVAYYAERDYQTFVQKRDRFNAFFGPGLHVNMYRDQNESEVWFTKGAQSIDVIVPRVLFLIRRYTTPQLGDLYRCYTNYFKRYDPEADYFTNFFVAETEAGLKIVAQYTLDSSGEAEDLCDRGLCWQWKGGVKITELGELVEERKFRAPDDDTHRAEYESA